MTNDRESITDLCCFRSPRHKVHPVLTHINSIKAKNLQINGLGLLSVKSQSRNIVKYKLWLMKLLFTQAKFHEKSYSITMNKEYFTEFCKDLDKTTQRLKVFSSSYTKTL